MQERQNLAHSVRQLTKYAHPYPTASVKVVNVYKPIWKVYVVIILNKESSMARSKDVFDELLEDVDIDSTQEEFDLVSTCKRLYQSPYYNICLLALSGTRH